MTIPNTTQSLLLMVTPRFIPPPEHLKSLLAVLLRLITFYKYQDKESRVICHFPRRIIFDPAQIFLVKMFFHYKSLQ